MKYTSIKKDSELSLNGISITVDRTDSGINSITFDDGLGGVIRCRMENYGWKVEVPAPPEMIEKYLLQGRVFGLEVREYFDSISKANERLDFFQNNSNDTCKLEVSSVSVPAE